MAKYTIRQGETGVFNIPVLDENGVAIDTSGSNISNIVATLSLRGVIINKYSLVSLGSEYGTITPQGINGVDINVTREQSSTWDTGTTAVTVTIKYTDDTVYDFEIDNFLEIQSSLNAKIQL